MSEILVDFCYVHPYRKKGKIIAMWFCLIIALIHVLYRRYRDAPVVSCWMNERMVGWMNGWVNGWVNGWMNGWMYG